MQFFLWIVPLTLCVWAEGADAPISYPLWDGQELVADYAKRVSLPPTKTLDLGGDVKLELVLIPAGKFIMGTPEPVLVDEAPYCQQIIAGKALLAGCSGALLVMLVVVICRAVRKKHWPQLSLGRLLLVSLAASGSVLSGLHWRHEVRGLQAAKADYEAAVMRYNSSWPFEKPAHSVTLTQPFYMGKFAVTQEQYQAVIQANPSHFKGRDNPVENISWDDAQAFTKKLTEQTKQTVRLPTEAEWEYACRAGTRTTYHSGDTESDLARVAWYAGNSKNVTHPVGQKEPNKFGLYDMHGNICQWCQDYWDERYYCKSPAENPQGPDHGALRVLRGGGLWGGNYMLCRSADRKAYFQGDPLNDGIGFRVVVPAFRTP